MTEKEALEKCILLWNKIKKTEPEHYDSSTYLEEQFKPKIYGDLGWAYDLNHCPCCEYTSFVSKKFARVDCRICPIDWRVEEIPYSCPCVSSYYGDWLDAKNKKEWNEACDNIINLAEVALLRLEKSNEMV